MKKKIYWEKRTKLEKKERWGKERKAKGKEGSRNWKKERKRGEFVEKSLYLQQCYQGKKTKGMKRE